MHDESLYDAAKERGEIDFREGPKKATGDEDKDFAPGEGLPITDEKN